MVVSGSGSAIDDGGLPRTFGSYTLLAQLGQGGMGEVFLAAKGGIEGISRRCVVKTLRAGFSDDREYVTRFLDEARVVAQLHHRNICPVFEVGKVGAQHFLAMEYIAGRDLKTVTERARAAGTPLSLSLSLHIVAETLEALDYAHSLRDVSSGDPLLLVHRDVSPHNVMIGFDGDVRLIDFGLAASTLKVEQTAPNVVMGKVAYMAPEHICGDPIDQSADQFAVAVMATELVLGTRFYEGKSMRDLYRLAAPGGYRPPGFQTLPSPLREAFDRALAANAADRFKTCAEFRGALDAFRATLPSTGRGDGPALKDLMHAALKDDLAKESAMLSRAAVIGGPTAPNLVVRSDDSDTVRETRDAHEVIEPTVRLVPVEPSAATASAMAASAPAMTASSSPSSSSSSSSSSSRGLRLAAAAAAVFAVAAVAVVALRPTEPPPPPPAAPPPPSVVVVAPPVVTPEPPPPPPPLVAPETPKTPKTPKPKPPTETPKTTTETPKTTTTAKPPSSSAPTGVRLRFVLEHCAAQPCAAKLRAKEKTWAALPDDELALFSTALKECFARCTP